MKSHFLAIVPVLVLLASGCKKDKPVVDHSAPKTELNLFSFNFRDSNYVADSVLISYPTNQGEIGLRIYQPLSSVPEITLTLMDTLQVGYYIIDEEWEPYFRFFYFDPSAGDYLGSRSGHYTISVNNLATRHMEGSFECIVTPPDQSSSESVTQGQFNFYY